MRKIINIMNSVGLMLAGLGVILYGVMNKNKKK
jgi:hypothetical protein